MRQPTGRLFLLAMLVVGCSLVVHPRHVLAFSVRRLAGHLGGNDQHHMKLPTGTRICSTLSDAPTELFLPEHVRTWLDVQLPEGRCVGVSIQDLFDNSSLVPTPDVLAANPDHWMHRAFHPDEVAYGRELSETTAASFWLGRLAMRIALDFPAYPILKDSFGRPQMNGRICGSISHKDDCGIALISNSTLVAGVGVDLELTSRPGKRSIAPRVLTEREQEALGKLPGVSVEEEVLLRFSLKEAIYKAAHPLLCQYVGFQEAEVTPYADGTATCCWFLESGADRAIGKLKAHWRRLDNHGFFLTSASVEKAE